MGFQLLCVLSKLEMCTSLVSEVLCALDVAYSKTRRSRTGGLCAFDCFQCLWAWEDYAQLLFVKLLVWQHLAEALGCRQGPLLGQTFPNNYRYRFSRPANIGRFGLGMTSAKGYGEARDRAGCGLCPKQAGSSGELRLLRLRPWLSALRPG